MRLFETCVGCGARVTRDGTRRYNRVLAQNLAVSGVRSRTPQQIHFFERPKNCALKCWK